MLNNKGLNQYDISDSKLCYKPTPRKFNSSVDRRQDSDHNNINSVEKINEKLLDFISMSKENHHELELKMYNIESMLQNQLKDNECLRSEVFALSHENKILKDKVDHLLLSESKTNAMSEDNMKLKNDIKDIRQSVIICEKNQNETIVNQINKMQEIICNQIGEMTKSIETAYDYRCKNLEQFVRRIAIKESFKKPKNVSINESFGNSSQGFEHTTNSDEGSNSEIPECSDNDKGAEVITNVGSSSTMPLFASTNLNSLIASRNLISDTDLKLSSGNANEKINIPESDSKSCLFKINDAELKNPSIPKPSLSGVNKPMFDTSSLSNKMFPLKLSDSKPLETTSIFMSKPSIFGIKDSSLQNFGSTNVKTSMFGSLSDSTFAFGSKPKDSESLPLFGNGMNVPSFGSLAGSGEKGFGSVTETKWQGGSKLFSKSQPKEEGDSVKEDDFNEHDPEFKPIIELPPLIEIIHDDDDKTVLFKNRCKLYRYANDEWKERGVGDMKILKSNSSGVVTLVMRREQIHKLCCNQRVTRNSPNLTSMGNDKSRCWIGADFSSGESTMEQFAVKFSDKSLMDEFCQVVSEAMSTQ